MRQNMSTAQNNPVIISPGQTEKFSGDYLFWRCQHFGVYSYCDATGIDNCFRLPAMPVFDPKICVYPDQAVQGSLAGKLPAFFCTAARLKGISNH